jgi:hypothetical protein
MQMRERECNYVDDLNESKSNGHDPVSFSLPFRDGVPKTRLGELAIADGEA